MKYNQLGKSDLQISALSFGSMRWQSEDECHRIIRRGMDLGMNYIDTSTGYVGGRSEQWSGRAVQARRDEIYFSSKTSYGRAPGAAAIRRAIEGSLRRTGLEYLDFYQLWGLSSERMLKSALARGGTVAGVRKAQAEGLIRHGIGFTFHGDARTFKAAIDSGEFLCATVSYNLSKRTHEPLLDYAAAKGVGTMIMNPWVAARWRPRAIPPKTLCGTAIVDRGGGRCAFCSPTRASPRHCWGSHAWKRWIRTCRR